MHPFPWHRLTASVSLISLAAADTKTTAHQVLVVFQRPNWLARDVSAMEDQVTKRLRLTGHDHRKTCDVPIISRSQCPGNCSASWAFYDLKVREGTSTRCSLH